MTATAQLPPIPMPNLPAGMLVCPPRKVEADWIDYNGHMNVGYYTLAFDKSSDYVYDEILWLGHEYVKALNMGPMVVIQTLHYINELLEGEEFRIHMQLLDHDAKKMHWFLEMRKTSDDALCATSELISINVDLAARKAAPYPAWALERIEAVARAHAGLPRPPQAGAQVGIRRKG